MGQKYLIDTNVLIDAQMGRLSDSGLKFLAKVINENFIVSFITIIKIPDAIIAATALTRNLILITNNEKDFLAIQELTVINLYSL